MPFHLLSLTGHTRSVARSLRRVLALLERGYLLTAPSLYVFGPRRFRYTAKWFKHTATATGLAHTAPEARFA